MLIFIVVIAEAEDIAPPLAFGDDGGFQFAFRENRVADEIDAFQFAAGLLLDGEDDVHARARGVPFLRRGHFRAIITCVLVFFQNRLAGFGELPLVERLVDFQREELGELLRLVDGIARDGDVGDNGFRLNDEIDADAAATERYAFDFDVIKRTGLHQDFDVVRQYFVAQFLSSGGADKMVHAIRQ